MMSAKTGKRTRKAINDELDPDFKMPSTSKSKEDLKSSKDEGDGGVNETNGLKGGTSKVEVANGENGDGQAESPNRVIQTRSRSNTPLIKTPDSTKSGDLEDTNGAKNVEPNDSVEDTNESVVNDEEIEESEDMDMNSSSNFEKEHGLQNGKNGVEEEKRSASTPTDLTDPVDPVVVDLGVVEKEDDEASELQFEYDVDVESEGSPSRCKTRRSDTRNVSTPKTPKVIVETEIEIKAAYVAVDRLPDDGVSERSTPKQITSSNDSNVGSSESQPDEIIDLDTSDTYSSVSTDNISTRAVAGSDATRNIDFSYQDSGLFDDNSLSNPNPNHSLADTLRNLSPRRTIRPITSDYRRLALLNNLEGKNNSYTEYESVERISVGTKRKNRSITPDQSKRLKKEAPGLLSYLSSFKGTLQRSSTPKLIGYDNKKSGFEEDENSKIKLEVDAEGQEKKWCSIM